MAAVRVCYLWEMGLMVKTIEMEQSRERRLQQLRQVRCWASTTGEKCPERKACDDRGCQLYADGETQNLLSGKR